MLAEDDERLGTGCDIIIGAHWNRSEGGLFAWSEKKGTSPDCGRMCARGGFWRMRRIINRRRAPRTNTENARARQKGLEWRRPTAKGKR